MSTTAAPTAAPPAFHLLAKPTGAVCNLDCTLLLLPLEGDAVPGQPLPHGRRPARDVHAPVRSRRTRAPEVTIAWQGGEPTLMGLDFFRRSVELARRYRRPGQRVEHTIQTNGTLLDDEWAAFFASTISSSASASTARASCTTPTASTRAARHVRRGRCAAWPAPATHGVEFNILVHASTPPTPSTRCEVYRFLRDECGAAFVQFIPIVERATPRRPTRQAPVPWTPGATARSTRRPGDLVTERSVTRRAVRRFLIDVFDEWVRRDVGDGVRADVRRGARDLGRRARQPLHPLARPAATRWRWSTTATCTRATTSSSPTTCSATSARRTCSSWWRRSEQRAFGHDKRDTLPRYCRECDVRFACHGGCPKDRFSRRPTAKPGLNYLCAGYKAFFHHVDAPMRFMAELLRRGRAARQYHAHLPRSRGDAAPPAATTLAPAAAAASSNTATGLPPTRAPTEPLDRF